MSDNNSKYGSKKRLTLKSKSVSKWYNEIVQKAELTDYGPARGTMIIRPYGYGIWENIQKALDAKIKKSGVKNAYFPLFIPNSLFNKEKEHVEGFSPQTAVVTIGGGKELADPLIVRPTSEMIMYESYARWISSWRDLPLVINQWNNVVRWEKRTYPFLRTSEFLWQEGHGAHATKEDNWDRVLWGIKTYDSLYRDYFAVAPVVGKKSESEKFAGADSTISCEVLVEGGKIIQACTSHDLGQNFSKTLNIKFQNKEGKSEYVWQNSWGFSTRSIGTLILAHGDDHGLILPPKIAPIKTVIIPVLGKKDEDIIKYCKKVKEEIEKMENDYPGDVEIWDDPEKSYGWKVNEAEIKGIPLRITIGTTELYDRTVTITKRIASDEKILVKINDLYEKINDLLENIQTDMLKKAEQYIKENTHEVNTYEELKELMKTKRGFIKAFWCEDPKCESAIKEETKASTRCLPLDVKEEDGKCVYCGKKAMHRWYFGLSY